MIVHPVTLDIARLAGKIEGQQAARGIAVAFEDLIIGATALHIGFDVATLNLKHFQLVPELKSSRSSRFAIGVDGSHLAFRGFLPGKTDPRHPYEATVTTKPL
jgi:hypothetical protein